MSGQPEAITRDELVAYYKRNTPANDTPADVARAIETCEHVADKIFADVQAHREPEYEPSSAYQDARGDIYLRSSIGDWVSYSGTRHAHDLPARPLSKMAAETRTAMALASKLNAIRDRCGDTELLSSRQVLAIIDGEGTCPGGC